MKFILVYSLVPLLLIGISIYVLDRFTNFNSILKTLLGLFPVLIYVIFIVEKTQLWQPSAGLPALFFTFAVFLGAFIVFLISLFFLVNEKIKKRTSIILLVISIIAPLLVITVTLTSNWFHISQYYSVYCFSSEGKEFSLHLDSADSSSSIVEIIGSGAESLYFYGSYTQQQDSIIVSGEKVINYNTLEDQTYIISQNEFYGFSSDSTSIFIEKCR